MLNIHLLVHAAEMVRRFGPLWGYSLFPFESKNGFIVSHCHAKQSILRSVMFQLLGSQVLRLCEYLIIVPQEVRVLNICRNRRYFKMRSFIVYYDRVFFLYWRCYVTSG